MRPLPSGSMKPVCTRGFEGSAGLSESGLAWIKDAGSPATSPDDLIVDSELAELPGIFWLGSRISGPAEVTLSSCVTPGDAGLLFPGTSASLALEEEDTSSAPESAFMSLDTLGEVRVVSREDKVWEVAEADCVAGSEAEPPASEGLAAPSGTRSLIKSATSACARVGTDVPCISG